MYPKKAIALVFLLFSVIQTTISQTIIFKETFDNIIGSTAGGAGTYTFPQGWLLRNVDNRTPAASVAYVNTAWTRREDFGRNVSDSAAFSTSWYSPSGSADDWMWTPLIGPLPAGTTLRWNALAYDASYNDGYEVRIMTSDVTPEGPTGGNAVIGNQITNSTLLYSNPAENSEWTSRTVDLSSYSGKSVYVAFRNNTVDKFLLLIDDVELFSNITLPVVWRAFTGKVKDNVVLLNWSTSEEKDTKDYIVEHSKNGINWNQLTTISAAGNSSNVLNYAYTHKAPSPGNNFYRILQRDLNRKSNYSKVVSVQFTEKQTAFRIVENPIAGKVLRIHVVIPGELNVYSPTGNIVFSKKVSIGNQDISIQSLASGSYVVALNGVVKRIIIP